MGMKRPRGILIICIVSFLIGAVYMFYGATFFGFGSIFAGAVGGILKGIGVGLLLIGGLVIAMAIGLLMMAEWALKWAAEFYGFLAAFAIILSVFNLLLIPTAIVYLLIFFYLRRSSTNIAFREFGYEKPDIHDSIAARKKAHTAQYQTLLKVEVLPPEISLNIPDNMVFCSQCQTLNLRNDKTCKMCATSLEE